MEIREENGLLGHLIYPHSEECSYVFLSSLKFKNNPGELPCRLERLLYPQSSEERGNVNKGCEKNVF